MYDIFGAIKEVFGFLRVVSDPDKKVVGYRLGKRKDLDKAMEAAEEMFHALDKYFLNSEEFDIAKLNYIYKRNRKRFFKYN